MILNFDNDFYFSVNIVIVILHAYDRMAENIVFRLSHNSFDVTLRPIALQGQTKLLGAWARMLLTNVTQRVKDFIAYL